MNDKKIIWKYPLSKQESILDDRYFTPQGIKKVVIHILITSISKR